MASPDVLEGDGKRYDNIEGKTVVGNRCRVKTASGCTFIGSNNKVTTATSCFFDGSYNRVTNAVMCDFVGKRNKVANSTDCTMEDAPEQAPAAADIGHDGQKYAWRTVLDARTGESFEDRRRRNLLKPLRPGELPAVNPRTGARDWIGASRRMDELENLTRGRTKAVDVKDLPEDAREVYEAGEGAGVVRLGQRRRTDPPAAVQSCVLCCERRATVKASDCQHAVVCGQCLEETLAYTKPRKCKECSKK